MSRTNSSQLQVIEDGGKLRNDELGGRVRIAYFTGTVPVGASGLIQMAVLPLGSRVVGGRLRHKPAGEGIQASLIMRGPEDSHNILAVDVSFSTSFRASEGEVFDTVNTAADFLPHKAHVNGGSGEESDKGQIGLLYQIDGTVGEEWNYEGYVLYVY